MPGKVRAIADDLLPDCARLGLAMIRARESRQESQATIAAAMGLGLQQVRAYEKAYRDWADKHPGESLD